MRWLQLKMIFMGIASVAYWIGMAEFFMGTMVDKGNPVVMQIADLLGKVGLFWMLADIWLSKRKTDERIWWTALLLMFAPITMPALLFKHYIPAYRRASSSTPPPIMEDPVPEAKTAETVDESYRWPPDDKSYQTWRKW